MTKTNLVDKECRSRVWLTPEHVLEAVRGYFGGPIELDPATEPNNPTKARMCMTEDMDGLSFGWRTLQTEPPKVFVNPPYGKGFDKWTAKFREEAKAGCQIVALLPPTRTETKYWQRDMLIPELHAICFVRGRLKFLRPDGTPAGANPYGTALYFFNDPHVLHDCCEVARHFGHLGKVVCVKEAG